MPKESFPRTERLSNVGNKQGAQRISKKENKTTSVGSGNEKQNNLKNHLLILLYKASDVIHIFFIYEISKLQ